MLTEINSSNIQHLLSTGTDLSQPTGYGLRMVFKGIFAAFF